MLQLLLFSIFFLELSRLMSSEYQTKTLIKHVSLYFNIYIIEHVIEGTIMKTKRKSLFNIVIFLWE